MENAGFCQVLLTKADMRGEDHVRSSREKGPRPSGFSLLVSPGVGSPLVPGLPWCGVSPGVGSPGVVNYNDGVSNVKPS